jgi:hypothetical protein
LKYDQLKAELRQSQAVVNAYVRRYGADCQREALERRRDSERRRD